MEEGKRYFDTITEDFFVVKKIKDGSCNIVFENGPHDYEPEEDGSVLLGEKLLDQDIENEFIKEA